MSNIQINLLRAFRQSKIKIESAPNSVDGLLAILNFLYETGRYQKLFTELFSCNDKNNLFSIILEATFAYHFEFKGKILVYEVRQAVDLTSVDFFLEINDSLKVYFELRLVQQRDPITQDIKSQLLNSSIYKVSIDGPGQQSEIIRLQRSILDKCQDRHGDPVKFFETGKGNCNIIVVEVSDLILGCIDKYDCLLATYGDPAVSEVYRRDVFGLFQNTQPSYPPRIQALSKEFAHIRSTIHGVLFLRKKAGGDKLNFRIEHCFIPNCNLLTHEEISAIKDELNYTLLPWVND